MQLHEFKISLKKRSQRIGRGGKRGTTAGRGTKGQHSRAGHRIRPAERDLMIRLPKLRGVTNKPLSVKPLVLNLKDLDIHKTKFTGGEVSLVSLKKIGLIPRRFAGVVKILSVGEVSAAFVVKGIRVSREARKKIEHAGGKVTV